MSKDKKFLLFSDLLMVVYLISYIFFNKLGLFDIILSGISIIGIVFYLYLIIKDKDLNKYKVPIILFSVIFFVCNIISGILGFLSIKDKTKKRELPKLDIEYNYKWYSYLIVLLIALFIMFFVGKRLTSYYQVLLCYLVILFMVLIAFRKDLKRDFKYFKEYFKEYNSFVFKLFGISLVVLFIISISIKLYTGISNPSNQESLDIIFDTKPLLITFLSIIYAPIAEELLFRGIFRKFINNKYLFIIISGFVFGLAHVIDDYKSIEELLYVFAYSSIGCFLAYTYYKTNNLCTNILFHFLQNSLSIISMFLLKIL